MSVSAETMNPDLKALFESPEAFAQRIKQLNDAKVAHDAALAALNLGQEAQAAHAEALSFKEASAKQRAEEEAKLQAEMQAAYAKLTEWTKATEVEVEAKMAAAKQAEESAMAKLASAQEALESASHIRGEAEDHAEKLLAEAKDSAAKVMSDALAKAKSVTNEASAKADAAEQAKSDAMDLKAKYEKALSAVQGAAATVNAVAQGV